MAPGHSASALRTRLGVWTGRLGGPRFATATLLDAVGSGTVMPLGVLFFTLHMHMRPTTVGLGLTIGGAAGIVLGPVGGMVADGIGPKPALVASLLASGAVAASWVFVHNLAALAAVEVLASFTGGVGWTAGTMFLTGLSGDREVASVMGAQYSLRNFGFGAGGLLSTLALGIGGIGFDLAVYANAASFLIAAILTVGVPFRTTVSKPDDGDRTTIWTVLTDRRYVSLALLASLISFNQIALQVILPLWVVLRTHAPHALVGLLFTANTLLVVTCQWWFSAAVTELREAPRAYRLASASMVLAGAVYLGAHYVGAALAVPLLLLGTVLLTATELWASACGFLVSVRLARAEHRGKYLSVFGMGYAIEGTVGPTAGTSLAASAILVLPWAAIAAAVTVGALSSAAIVRRVADASVAEETPGAAVR